MLSPLHAFASCSGPSHHLPVLPHVSCSRLHLSLLQNASKGGDDTGKGSGHSKKRSRRSRKKKTDEKQAKHFTVRVDDACIYMYLYNMYIHVTV